MAKQLVIGGDYGPALSGVRDAATGLALTTADVAFQLYTAAGVAVGGGDGTATYVAASAGTATDAAYAGAIDDAVTATLTAGPHYILYTVSVGGDVRAVEREDLTAVAPGGVIIDVPSWCAAAGISLVAGSADELSVMSICSYVSRAIQNACRPHHFTPLTLSNVILDAPPDRDIELPVRPARSITSVYYRSDAHGVAANFTSDYLLDNTDGDEYQLVIDDKIFGISRAGILRRVDTIWGLSLVRPLGRLAYRQEADRGALMVTYAAGFPFPPEDVQAAAVHLVTKLVRSRTHGAQPVSASLNGASYSLPSAIGSLWADPIVADLLRPYRSVFVG